MKSHPVVFEHEGQIISYREAQVLLCCTRGLTAQQTADLLFICAGTVNRHRENLRHRFGLKGHHTLACLANKLLPELEKCVELPIKMCNTTH